MSRSRRKTKQHRVPSIVRRRTGRVFRRRHNRIDPDNHRKKESSKESAYELEMWNL